MFTNLKTWARDVIQHHMAPSFTVFLAALKTTAIHKGPDIHFINVRCLFAGENWRRIVAAYFQMGAVIPHCAETVKDQTIYRRRSTSAVSGCQAPYPRHTADAAAREAIELDIWNMSGWLCRIKTPSVAATASDTVTPGKLIMAVVRPCVHRAGSKTFVSHATLNNF